MYSSSMNDTGEAKETSTSSDTTIFSLIRAAHALEDKLERALDRAGLSSPKFSVLSELVTAERPLSLSDLAAKLSCVRSNMTQLVDRLEADGFVRRVDDPADRRGVRAEITEEGRARHSAGTAEVGRLHEEFASSVAAADRAAFERLLSALG